MKFVVIPSIVALLLYVTPIVRETLELLNAQFEMVP